jgi:hypothetical protein
MPDAQGNVDLFGDTDVDNAVNGKIFSVNRRAAEGDTTLSIYGRADRYAVIDANWDIEINSNVASGRIKLGAVSTNIVNLLGSTENSVGWGNGTDNPLWRHYGYITAGGLSGQRYIQYKVDDTDDYYWLTRQSVSILGFKVDMPVDFVSNNLSNIGTLGAGATTVTDLTDSGLTASQALMTDVDKKLISVDYLNQAVKTTSSPQFNILSVTGIKSPTGALTNDAIMSFGANSTADQDNAINIGIGGDVLAPYAINIGQNGYIGANAEAAAAIGASNTILAPNGAAVGVYNYDYSGDSNTNIGAGNGTSGYYLTNIGRNNQWDSGSETEGAALIGDENTGANSSHQSTAIGTGNRLNGQAQVMLGFQCTGSGDYTFNIGKQVTNNTSNSVGLGIGGIDVLITAGAVSFQDSIIDWSGATHAKPKIYTQSTEPNIANDSYAFWKDSDDSKYYLILDIGGTQKKLELT